MKVNSMKALDYRAEGETLTLILAETTMEAVTGMNTAVLDIVTDDGDAVESFAGYALDRVLYNVAAQTYTAVLSRVTDNQTAAALDRLQSENAELRARADEQDAALIELAELIGGADNG